jgi:hypothetical protein
VLVLEDRAVLAWWTGVRSRVETQVIPLESISAVVGAGAPAPRPASTTPVVLEIEGAVPARIRAPRFPDGPDLPSLLRDALLRGAVPPAPVAAPARRPLVPPAPGAVAPGTWAGAAAPVAAPVAPPARRPIASEPPTEPLAPQETGGPSRTTIMWIGIVGALALLVVGVVAYLTLRDPDPVARPVAVPTVVVTPSPAPEETTEPEPTATSTPTSVDGDGWTAELPDGWEAGKPQSENGGQRRVTEVSGPDGESIRIVHTPGTEAQPPEELITDELPLETDAESSRVVLLDGFPTPGCQDRVCSDFLLNDPAWGGLAILVEAEPGDAAYDVAEDIATSVRAG